MRGLFAVATTPFDKNGQQDLETLEKCTNRALDAGVDGVLTLGATGEALALSPEEREAQVKKIVEVVDGKVPVVVGCMDYSPSVMVDMIRDAEKWGASAAMITPPFYGGLEPANVVDVLGSVLSEATLPTMVYNNPGATGVDLEPEYLGEFLKYDSFWSVKETSGGAARVREVRDVVGNDVEVFVGADGLALEGFTQGASGWVAASAWLAPAQCAELWKAADSGNWADAVELWNALAGPLGTIEGSPAFISLIKQALGKFGFEQGPVRPPLPTASEDVVDQLAKELGR